MQRAWGPARTRASGLYRGDAAEFATGGAVALAFDRALPPTRTFGRATLVEAPPRRFDTLPDLGVDIGSATWWRGAAACSALCAATLALSPGLRPLTVVTGTRLAPVYAQEARTQSIAPLAWGGDSGRHMAATDAVQQLTDAPERPQIELAASIGQGDGLSHALSRAGVGASEAARVAAMAGDVVDAADITPGTALAITLGARARRTDARPLLALAFRARLDMRLSFVRVGNELRMQRLPIAIDRTPLRVSGRVGDSLYASARAAGASPKTVETYIRALAPKVPMGDLSADDRFDLVVEANRAATGEVEYGKLLYVGLTQGSRATRMIEWTIDGHTEWYDAAGVGERRSGFVLPVAGAHKTSGFGMRMHPLLGYSRMHQGTDYGAVYGSPIRAVTDGVVAFAGWHGGHGNMVKLAHMGGLGTGYAHMSRIAVAPGARVAQGQVIGYVGSTGLSTGPHLHFEVYRGGVPVNPSSVSFASTSLLEGAQLEAFRARLASLVGR